VKKEKTSQLKLHDLIVIGIIAKKDNCIIWKDGKITRDDVNNYYIHKASVPGLYLRTTQFSRSPILCMKLLEFSETSSYMYASASVSNITNSTVIHCSDAS
jgi:hypothetical protein